MGRSERRSSPLRFPSLTKLAMKRKAVYLVIIVLALLHQDFWLWDDASLLFGFLPVGLAYHAVYSILAGLVWLLALTYAWPAAVEAFAKGDREKEDSPE